jgi:hypothetical protein
MEFQARIVLAVVYGEGAEKGERGKNIEVNE